MRADAADPTPTPAELIGWLRSTGWEDTSRDDRWATMQRVWAGETVFVDVPLRVQAPDYPRVAEGLLADLAALQERSLTSIQAELRGASLDVLRFALGGPSFAAGGLPLSASVDCLQAARDLCAAAACSVVSPRAAYLGRKPVLAMAFLEQARWARVEQGSVVLCLEVPVPPRLQTVLPGPPPVEEEFARRVTHRLLQGTAALSEALPLCVARGDLSAVEAAVSRGVSANLCEAAAGLLDGGVAEELHISVAFAARRPVLEPVPGRVTFRRGDLPLLREVARGLQRQAVEQDVEVVGPVVRLHRDHGAAGGVVTVQAEIEGRLRLVRMAVGAADYEVGLLAHRDYRFVRASGALRAVVGGFELAPRGALGVEEAVDGG